MKTIDLESLKRASEMLATHGWSDAEIEQLVAAEFGIITGLQSLLEDLERLGRIDLGTTPPAGALQASPAGK